MGVAANIELRLVNVLDGSRSSLLFWPAAVAAFWQQRPHPGGILKSLLATNQYTSRRRLCNQWVSCLLSRCRVGGDYFIAGDARKRAGPNSLGLATCRNASRNVQGCRVSEFSAKKYSMVSRAPYALVVISSNTRCCPKLPLTTELMLFLTAEPTGATLGGQLRGQQTWASFSVAAMCGKKLACSAALKTESEGGGRRSLGAMGATAPKSARDRAVQFCCFGDSHVQAASQNRGISFISAVSLFLSAVVQLHVAF